MTNRHCELSEKKAWQSKKYISLIASSLLQIKFPRNDNKRRINGI